jgi:hypothetical protein
MMRAARFTHAPKKSLSRRSTMPACRPQRAASATPSAPGIGECLLELQSGTRRVLRVVEGGAHAVAGHLDHAAAMRSTADRRASYRGAQRGFHARRLALPQLGAAFDVGEEEAS